MFAKFRKFVNINVFSFYEAACSQLLNVGAVIAFQVCVNDVMLEITRGANREVVIKLGGRMGAENLGELEKLISTESDGRRIVLGLKDRKLVKTLSVFVSATKRTASSSRIAQYLSGSRSRENEDEHRNQNSN